MEPGRELMARVLLEGVTKKYGDVLAVDNLTMDVRDREFLVLIGPSGCGKSTVLRLVAGLEQVTSGSIRIDGVLANDLTPRERDIAMVFESPGYALYPNMSAYDNMAFSLHLRKDLPVLDDPQASEGLESRNSASTGRGAREKAIHRRVEKVAGRLGLGKYLSRRQEQLSAGHRQGVALGRAMVRRPKVFLMDDPLSNLDARMRVTSRVELRKLHRELESTVLYVTHDQSEAMALGDRIAVMKEGVLQQIGTPQSLYERPANMFVAGFIGSPPMNMFTVDVESREGELFLRGPGFDLLVPQHNVQRLSDYQGRRLVLGLRPESIRDARHAPDADPAALIDTYVDLLENTGSDVYAHLVAGGRECVARLDARTHTKAGERLLVALDLTDMHAFDPTSQRSLL
jgi:multiple sugar transport system ATP-binding protein